MARKSRYVQQDSPQHQRQQLPQEAIAALHRVIERVNKLEAEWLQPGLDAGLPYHDTHAIVSEQRERARRYLAAHGPDQVDTGAG